MRRKNKIIAKVDEATEKAGMKSSRLTRKGHPPVDDRTKKGYNEKNPGQPEGAFQPDANDEPVDKA